MKKIRDFVAGLLGSVFGLALLPLFFFSVPLSVIAVMRLTGWDWWGALITVVVGGVIPVVGWIGYVVATVLGAYYFIDADFSWRRAVSPEIETFRLGDLTPDEFSEFRDKVIRRDIERQCKRDVGQRFESEGKIPASVSDYCECYARVAASTFTQVDAAYLEKHKRPTPDFEDRVMSAARKCRPGG